MTTVYNLKLTSKFLVFYAFEHSKKFKKSWILYKNFIVSDQNLNHFTNKL